MDVMKKPLNFIEVHELHVHVLSHPIPYYVFHHWSRIKRVSYNLLTIKKVSLIELYFKNMKFPHVNLLVTLWYVEIMFEGDVACWCAFSGKRMYICKC